MDDDDDDLRLIAQEYVDRLGWAAIDELLDRAEIAAGAGDHASTETWRDVARVAEKLLS